MFRSRGGFCLFFCYTHKISEFLLHLRYSIIFPCHETLKLGLAIYNILLMSIWNTSRKTPSIINLKKHLFYQSQVTDREVLLRQYVAYYSQRWTSDHTHNFATHSLLKRLHPIQNQCLRAFTKHSDFPTISLCVEFIILLSHYQDIITLK